MKMLLQNKKIIKIMIECKRHWQAGLMDYDIFQQDEIETHYSIIPLFQL
jgi:hypothetical protein